MGGLARRNMRYQSVMEASMATPPSSRDVEVGKPLPFHPDYPKLLLEFNFHEASYRGGARYKDAKDSHGEDVLVQHEQESGKAWKRRKRMSTCHNFCRPIVDKMVQFVFSHPVRRHGTGPVGAFIEDCDGEGTTLHEVMRYSSLQASVLGKWFLMLDTTKPMDNMTLAQAQAAGSRVIIDDLDPRRVIDWSGDMYLVTDDSVGPSGGARIWRELTYQDVILDDDKKVKSIGQEVRHGWDGVPIIEVAPHCSGESMITDVSELQMSIFNLGSILTEELSKQVFSQWWMACPDASGDMLKAFDVGSRKVIVLPVDANSVKFERLSGDPSQAQAIRDAMESEVREIYRTMGLKDPTTESGPESGKALRIRFTESAFRASELADMAEDAERKIIDLVGMAMGTPADKSEYPDDFDEENLREELAATLQVISANLPSSAKRAQVRKWSTAAFANQLDQDEQVEMSKEIEVMYPAREPGEAGDASPSAVKEGEKDEVGEDKGAVQNPALGRPEQLDQRKQQNPAYAPGSRAPRGPMVG